MEIGIKELQLEHLIFSYRGDQKVIREKGLIHYEHEIVIKELNLGCYGRLDLIGIEMYQTDRKKRCINITIYELKQKVIGIKALSQASRYLSGIKRYVDSKEIYKNINIEYQVVLIGDSIDFSSDFCYLGSEFPNLSCYLYSFGINGLTFKNVCLDNFGPSDFDTNGFGKLSKISHVDIHKDMVRNKIKEGCWIMPRYYFAHFD